MGVSVDCRALKKFRDNMAKLNKQKTQQFTEAAVKELAARLLRKTMLRTPVGIYPPGSGKTGGTLRRNWTIGNVVRSGGMYSIDIMNPTEYAIYVEYGHRTAGGVSWINGRFMLTVSEQELKRDAPRILQNKLSKFVRENIGGQ
jgi:hypothetical protein